MNYILYHLYPRLVEKLYEAVISGRSPKIARQIPWRLADSSHSVDQMDIERSKIPSTNRWKSFEELNMTNTVFHCTFHLRRV